MIWMIYKRKVIEIGTSTIFRRYNDFGGRLVDMSKEDLEKIDKMSPWGAEKERVHGWSVLVELHNGNINPLIWWYGRLLHLRDAPKILTKKYYDKYSGKHLRVSEWTLLKVYLERELKALDKEYKKERARQYRQKNKHIT